MEKLLTITVPVYNTEQYLPRCLDSLIAPDHMDKIEVLVVIDGSPDNSLAVAQTYEQKYPQTFRVISKPNGGHGSAIKRGISEATGKYFKVLDSDDWFDQVEFEKFLIKLQHLDVDLVLTNYTQELAYMQKTVYHCCKWTKHEKIYEATDNMINPGIMIHNVTYSLEVVKDSKMEGWLFNGFHNDMQYVLYPLLLIKNFVFLDFYVYRYFIGRPEQSISAANIVKNWGVINEIMHDIVKFYMQCKNREHLWIKDTVFSSIESCYTILLLYLPFSSALKECKKWNFTLKVSLPDIYKIKNKSIWIRWFRRIPILILLIIRSYKMVRQLVRKSNKK